MADPNDTDLDWVVHTESSARNIELYTRMQQWQFDRATLEDPRFDEDDLTYIAGHRAYDFPAHGRYDVDEALGIQQKVRGNAIRAKDELDRRERERDRAHAAEQLAALNASNDAVAASNDHMRSTATWTRWMAVGTIVIALATIWTVLQDDDPTINVTGESTTTTTR